jgi:hypothetical protein
LSFFCSFSPRNILSFYSWPIASKSMSILQWSELCAHVDSSKSSFRLKTICSPMFSGCHSEKKTTKENLYQTPKKIIKCLQLNKNSSSYILLTIYRREFDLAHVSKSRLAFSRVFRLELTDFATVAELKGGCLAIG